MLTAASRSLQATERGALLAGLLSMGMASGLRRQCAGRGCTGAIRIGVTGHRELDDPAAIEWERGRLVPEASISIPIEARSGPSRSRTLFVEKDDE
jgi:hypothetical protein